MRSLLLSIGALALSTGFVACSAKYGGAGATVTSEAGVGAGGDDATGASDGGAGARAGGPGHVVFRLPDDHWHRIAADVGGAPEDLSQRLDAISAGDDQAMNVAPDGQWLMLDTSRFGCANGECLGVARVDGTGAALVPSNAAPILPLGRGVVARGGDLLVYPRLTAPDRSDLYALARAGGAWGAEVKLTGASPKPYQHDVAIARDGSKVIFDCGPSQYQDNGTCLCEVRTDGSDFRVVLCPENGPDGSVNNELHHPAYAPDGSIVFEADWAPGGASDERVWRMDGDGKNIRRVSPDGTDDDNSPCVLPDGRVVSLWLGRVEADGAENGIHELKVMNPDGSGAQMLLTDVDVVDVGLGCAD